MHSKPGGRPGGGASLSPARRRECGTPALTITCRNFDVVEEILVKLALSHPELTIEEVPVRFKKRMFGASKRELMKLVFSYLKTLRRLFRLKYTARPV